MFITLKKLATYYFLFLALATFAYVRTARQAKPILAMTMLWASLWWVILGAKRGLVWWHPAYANFDRFGPLMVLGPPMCLYFGLATTTRWVRLLAFAIAMRCVARVDLRSRAAQHCRWAWSCCGYGCGPIASA